MRLIGCNDSLFSHQVTLRSDVRTIHSLFFLSISGARVVPRCRGALPFHRLYRRDRRRGHQEVRLQLRGREGNPEDYAGTPQPAGRIRLKVSNNYICMYFVSSLSPNTAM